MKIKNYQNYQRLNKHSPKSEIKHASGTEFEDLN